MLRWRRKREREKEAEMGSSQSMVNFSRKREKNICMCCIVSRDVMIYLKIVDYSRHRDNNDLYSDYNNDERGGQEFSLLSILSFGSAGFPRSAKAYRYRRRKSGFVASIIMGAETMIMGARASAHITVASSLVENS